MKYSGIILLLSMILIPANAGAVKCPIPNCPAGQLCFCPPPPPHFFVLEVRGNNVDKKIVEKIETYLKNSFDLTAMFKFRDKFAPRAFKITTPADQISRWSMISFNVSNTKNGLSFGVEYHERFPIHSRKKTQKWKTSMSTDSTKDKILHAALDTLGNQAMEQILGNKFEAFGTRLAYVETIKTGTSVIRMAHVNGKNYGKSGNGGRLLSFSRSLNKGPVFSPDGRFLVFTSHIRYNPDLYIVKTDGSKSPHRISARNGMNHAASFSPDGSKLALTLDYRGNADVYTLNSDYSSTKKWRISKKLTKHHDIDTSPEYSPDGKRLAFVSARGGSAQIFTYDFASGRIRKLFSTKSRTFTPRWCKSGNREYIAFTQLVGAKSVIYIYDVVAKNGWQATSSAAPNAENPAWSPHCNLIAYESEGAKGKAAGIWISPVRGGHSRVLYTGKLAMPAWEMKKN
ncbi:hypothetical protein KKF34_11190 [Myxococcota bacterium]|nr:hypothetical protein [Myxococcota bacterium]MBU1382537.1 hypothetical protein [Myxococcota bacterium]MBU1497429.1 hypothetical protein [Myxococcota bacterium]